MTIGATDEGATRNRAGRDAFAGADQNDLRDGQYAGSTKLAMRANLHVKYGRATWFPWWAGQVPWPAASDSGALAVLDRLRAAVGRRFAAGGGTFEITEDVGLFICTDPR